MRVNMLGAFLVAGLTASVARADDWQMMGLDLGHTRMSAERSGALFGDAAWSVSAPYWTLASPVVADGFVVTATMDGVISAHRADTGELAWEVSLNSAVHGTPTIVRGRVFVPTVSYDLFALRLADGATLWKRDIGGMIYSSPTPVDGDIVVAPGFPKMTVVRLSGETGALIWESSAVMFQFSNTAPAVGGGLVVVGSQQGRYYAFDALTGALRWQYTADGIVHLATPIIFGGRVYMAGGDQSNNVHAVDAAMGTAVPGWPITLPTPAPDIAGTRQGGWRAVSSFAAAGGLLLLQTRLDDALGARANGPFNYLSREVVLALNPSSGAVVWQHAMARAETMDPNDVPKFFVCPTPAAYGTDGGAPLVAVASSLAPLIAVLDVASGSEKAHYTVAGAALASPVVANGRLFTTDMNGTTKALGSSVNHPPAAPVPARYADPIDLAKPMLGWSSAVDPDGETASYELRVDADGETLETWRQQLFVNAGITSTPIAAAALAPGVTYTFTVRARDPRGALSPWSAPGTFTVIGTPGTPDVMPPGETMPPGGTMPPDGTMPPAGTPVPQITILEPTPTTTQPTASAPDQSPDPAAGGCAIGGRMSGGWTTVLALSVFFAVRARRRKKST